MSNSALHRLDSLLNHRGVPAYHGGRVNYLVEKLGITRQTIHSWYRAQKIPPSKLAKIAEAFDINTHWLATGDGTCKRVPDTISLEAHQTVVPLLSWDGVKAWLDARENAVSFEPGQFCVVSLKEMSDFAFALIVQEADSEPLFPIGTTVFIDPMAKKPHQGAYVLVQKADGLRPFIRQWVTQHDTTLLVSPHPAVPTTKFMPEDSLLGVVKKHQAPTYA